MVYKNVSCKAVLAKIYRDLKPGYTGWEADAVEWIGEALDYMGCSAGFEHHSENVSVFNHRATLPANFYTLNGVYFKGEKLPFGGGFNTVNSLFSFLLLPGMSQKTITDPNAVTIVNPRTYSGDYYIVNPNYIQTSFESGEINIRYDRYPLDKDGLPMVPDNVYVKTACVWYVLKQMLLSGSVTSQLTFGDAKGLWEHACIQAGNDAMFPSPEKAERFREMWVRMIPIPGWNTDPTYELDYDSNPLTKPLT